MSAIAANFKNKGKLPIGVEESDLISWGIEGLIKAKQKFNEKKGSKFSTYAFYRIRGEIFDRIREEWGYRNPVSYQEHRKQIQEKIADLIENALNTGQELTPEKLGDYAQSIISNSAMSYLISLDSILEIQEPASEEHKKIEETQDHGLVKEAIAELSDEEQEIIRLFYFENLKQKDIAKQLNFSNSKISRIHIKVLEKLKRKLKNLDA